MINKLLRLMTTTSAIIGIMATVSTQSYAQQAAPSGFTLPTFQTGNTARSTQPASLQTNRSSSTSAAVNAGSGVRIQPFVPSSGSINASQSTGSTRSSQTSTTQSTSGIVAPGGPASSVEEEAPVVIPGQIAGRASSVHDGTTFHLQGRTIKIINMDAPRIGNSCKSSDNFSWDCGRVSRDTLTEILKSEPVQCQSVGAAADGAIIFAQCKTRSGDDIGETMIALGAARKPQGSTDPYLTSLENYAKVGKRGLWR